MPSLWPRRVIGKLVQKPGGPIIEGFDHKTTARSTRPPFPEVGVIVDHEKGLGIDNHQTWLNYPTTWTQGALLLRPFRSPDGVTHLVASRMRSYLEDPEKPLGRSYIETIHAAHPVATLDFAELFQIPRLLITEPLTASDKDFAPLAVDKPEQVLLPPDWFAEARAMLAALVDGTRFVVIDHKRSADEFFMKALIAAACLPGAIRWRATIAAGVYSLPVLDKGIVKYQLCLPYQSSSATTPVSDSAGASYANWFAQETDDGRCCETLRDILDWVDAKFPDWLEWDALPVELDCGEASKPLAELRDIERIRDWCLRPNGGPPNLSRCLSFRPEVLELAAKALNGPAETRDALLPELLQPEWRPAWSSFASRDGKESRRMAAVGGLLGMIEPFDPSSLADELERSPLELSPNLDRLIHAKLSSSLESRRDAGALEPWAGLLRRAFARRTPRWFERWVNANAENLLWRAARLQLTTNSIDIVSYWNTSEFTGAPAAFQELLQCRAPSEPDFQKLLGLVGNADRADIRKLLDHVESTLPEAALRLAIEARLDEWLSPRLRPEAIATRGIQWFNGVVAIALARSPLHPGLMTSILPFENHLPTNDRQRLRERLRTSLGSLDSILYGDRPELTRAPIAGWLWPIVGQLCALDSKRRRNVLAAACKSPELVTPEFEEFLLRPVLAGNDLATIAPSWCASLKFVLALREGKRVEFPADRGEKLAVARLWQPLLVQSGRPSPKAPRLTRLDQLESALWYGRNLDPFPPLVDSTFWVEWLAMVGSTERQGYYWDLIQNAGLQSMPFWRFTAGWERIALTNEEIEHIETQSLLEPYFRAVLRGAPLVLDLSRNLRSTLISRFCHGPDQCWVFLEKCRAVGDEGAAVDFWKHSLANMTRDDVDELRRAIRRGPVSRVLHTMKDHLFVRSEGSEGWTTLALEIYDSSNKKIRMQLDHAIEVVKPPSVKYNQNF